MGVNKYPQWGFGFDFAQPTKISAAWGRGMSGAESQSVLSICLAGKGNVVLIVQNGLDICAVGLLNIVHRHHRLRRIVG